MLEECQGGKIDLQRVKEGEIPPTLLLQRGEAINAGQSLPKSKEKPQAKACG
jgi:hypothetical protein